MKMVNLRKGSPEAKQYMAYLRSLRRGGSRKRGRRTSVKYGGNIPVSTETLARNLKSMLKGMRDEVSGGSEFLTGVVE